MLYVLPMTGFELQISACQKPLVCLVYQISCKHASLFTHQIMSHLGAIPKLKKQLLTSLGFELVLWRQLPYQTTLPMALLGDMMM